ncbi:MAG: MFS transporter [Acidobacteria bacterium]|nr:MAG: MFS transporter [Acidobacteriota bacterium]PYS13077.1 MAG: MFS transporter [Acidobacteriota bacterium]
MKPSRARFTLLRFAFALSVVTYLDRVCIATAATSIREDLHLSAVQMGWIFSTFTLAYAIFEIPSGWLGDTIGPRRVLTRIVLWWSAFTMATGAAWSYVSLLAFRFLFGAGEAGAFPNASRSFSQWFPTAERGRAHGIIFMGTRLGGALAPPLAIALITAVGWRASFWIFGSLGIFWAVLWWRWFRDDPRKHPSVNADELHVIEQGRGGAITHREFNWRLFLNANLLFICLTYFAFGYGLYFYLTWLQTYLREARGFSAGQASLLASIVLLSGAMASVIGGFWTDRWVDRYGLKIGRCGVASTALVGSGLILAGAAIITNSLAAALLIALAAGIADLSISAAWAVCLDIGRESAGTVTGCMNTFANLGGAIAPVAMGYAVQWWGSWSTPLLITAVIYVAGGLTALLIDPNKSLTHLA